MNHATLLNQVLPAMLRGVSRQPLPPTISQPPADLLSLLGQALRFEPPPIPGSFRIETAIDDDRPILPEALRRPLLRVLLAKGSSPHPGFALARAFRRSRLRPHPFDLPHLDSFVNTHAESLGPTAQHWASRQQPSTAPQNYFDPVELDAMNWAHATLSRRVSYLDHLRRGDPAAARDLLIANWSNEAADARFALLQTLQASLSLADQPFLESLDNDRSQRVRALAQKFLGRLGAHAANPALAACLERIVRSESGFLRKRPTLKLELPVTLKDQTTPQWILQTFSAISFAELAAALKLSEAAIIEAAAADEWLLFGLAAVATLDARLDLLAVIVKAQPATVMQLFQGGFSGITHLTEADRQQFGVITLGSFGKALPQSIGFWDWLHRLTDTEMPATTMSAILGSKFLDEVSEPAAASVAWFECLAAMCPPNQRPALRLRFAELSQLPVANPITLLEVLEGIEKGPSHV